MRINKVLALSFLLPVAMYSVGEDDPKVCSYALLTSTNTSIKTTEWQVWQYMVMTEFSEMLEIKPVCKEPVNIIEVTYKAYYAGLSRGIAGYAKLYGKSSEKIQYFEDLSKVETAGFLPEYIWNFHSGPSWGEKPGNIRTGEFHSWLKENIPSHVVRRELAVGTAIKSANDDAIHLIPHLK